MEALSWKPADFPGESDGADTNTYQDCSKRIACSWFSANPVYCLRSQYIYKHSPPCLFCIPGKEHLIEVNEDIGLYFNDCAAKDFMREVERGFWYVYLSTYIT